MPGSLGTKRNKLEQTNKDGREGEAKGTVRLVSVFLRF